MTVHTVFALLSLVVVGFQTILSMSFSITSKLGDINITVTS